MLKTKHNRAIGHMLPHNSFTSVAIAVLLLNWKSPYGLQEPKYKNPICAPKEDNWA